MGRVGEDFGVHEPVSITISERLPARPSDLPGEGAAGPLWQDLSGRLGTSVDVDVKSLRSITGAGLLAGMSRLSLGDISTFVADNPAQIDKLLAVPPAATKVAQWWSGLGGSERAALAAAAPRLVGNLDGVPVRERGRANARYLDQTVSTVERRLADAPDGAEAGPLGQELAMLGQVRAALRSGDAGPRRSLMLLDASGGGRAVIVLGNPDTADYVSYLVPGLNYGVQEQLVNWSSTADALYAEQTEILARRAAAHPGAPVASVATIAWIGYQTPDLFSVGGLDRAEAGADFLEKSWLGIRSARGSHQPFISVLAHSYGSTVALVALARGSVDVDAFVMVGSPGSAAQSVDDLSVAHRNVYVGEADWDPAVNSAFFGSDPGAASYGAHKLGVSGARDRVTGRWLEGSIGHNAYFAPGSESLHNMALISTDNAKLATDGSE